jgi:hypothetical protein
MELIKSKKANINYLSKIVNITTFRVHPNAEKLKCCTIDGYNIITGIDSEPGFYVYFPALSQINSDFLSYANLYRHKELNRDSTQSGMFEDNGRVKVIKLRGELSEGFILPIIVLENYITSITNKELTNIQENIEFDAVRHEEKEFWISKKYIAKASTNQETFKSKTKEATGKFNKIIDGQFRFHYDTILIKKCPFVLSPDSIIQISAKIHGTSGVSARVLCKTPLTWKDRIINFINERILRNEPIKYEDYDYLYASRSVIKNKYYNPKVTDGFYGCDVWAEADKIVRPHLEKGQTAYYEIVGFLPTGSFIQKSYDYGCILPKGDSYKSELNFKVRIYRITYTNIDGKVLEYTTHQVQQWCSNAGLIPVKEYYYGRAGDLYPEIDEDSNWNEKFIDKLSNESRFYMEQISPDCNNKVPHEGIVIKIEDGLSRAFKLKCFAFLGREQQALDKGETNIEEEA